MADPEATQPREDASGNLIGEQECWKLGNGSKQVVDPGWIPFGCGFILRLVSFFVGVCCFSSRPAKGRMLQHLPFKPEASLQNSRDPYWLSQASRFSIGKGYLKDTLTKLCQSWLPTQVSESHANSGEQEVYSTCSSKWARPNGFNSSEPI